MKRLLAAMMLLCLVGCGTSQSHEAYKTASDFIGKVKGDQKLPTIQLATSKNIFLYRAHSGSCVKFAGYSHILIDEHFWENQSPGRKWAVLMHEVAHCVFNIKHAEMSYPCPSSLVSPVIGPEKCYDEKGERRAYINELKERIHGRRAH